MLTSLAENGRAVWVMFGPGEMFRSEHERNSVTSHWHCGTVQMVHTCACHTCRNPKRPSTMRRAGREGWAQCPASRHSGHTCGAELSSEHWASLVVQWLRICLQETQVQSLVREDSTCCKVTAHVPHHWTCALEPGSHNYWAHMPRALLPSRRSHCNEEPMPHNQRGAPLTAARESLWSNRGNTTNKKVRASPSRHLIRTWSVKQWASEKLLKSRLT